MKKLGNHSITATLLIIVCVFAHGTDVRCQANSTRVSEMIDSFGLVPNGDLKGRLDTFLVSLANDPDSKGLIVIYGSGAQVAARQWLIRNQVKFRRFDASRIDFQNGRNIGTIRSDFWIIPRGAALPDLKPESFIFAEITKAYKRDFDRTFKMFIDELLKRGDHQAYIINYGTPREVGMRERWLRNAFTSRRFDPPRITIVNGGKGPARTRLWLVPPGAENPAP